MPRRRFSSSTKKSGSFLRDIATCGCAFKYSYRLVVPDFIAPITRKVGSTADSNLEYADTSSLISTDEPTPHGPPQVPTFADSSGALRAKPDTRRDLLG